MRMLDFFYEFASTYSYVTAMRIAPLAEAAGVTVRWRPFLLGPIFKQQGWDTSPFNLYPAKGRYMVRDCERQCAALGIAFRLPDPFPQNTLTAARVALAALTKDGPEEVSRAVYRAQFAEGRQIGSAEVIGAIVRPLDARCRRAGARAVRRDQAGAARRDRGGERSASSARRASSRAASCSGAMTGSSRRSRTRKIDGGGSVGRPISDGARCGLCIARCGTIATVEEWPLHPARSRPSHPTGAALCAKGRAAPELVYHKDRLTQPLAPARPKGDADPGWEEISWDAALDRTAAAMRRIARAARAAGRRLQPSSPSTTAIGDSGASSAA